MNGYGRDENGYFRVLLDGRTLRARVQFYNAILTLSSSYEDYGWSHGW